MTDLIDQLEAALSKGIVSIEMKYRQKEVTTIPLQTLIDVLKRYRPTEEERTGEGTIEEIANMLEGYTSKSRAALRRAKLTGNKMVITIAQLTYDFNLDVDSCREARLCIYRALVHVLLEAYLPNHKVKELLEEV